VNFDDERRHMLSLAAAIEEREWFDYSEEQWQAIKAIVEQDLEPAKRGGWRDSNMQPIMGWSISAQPRPGLSTPTKPFNYRALRTAANCFLDEKWPPPDERRRALKALVERCEEFRFALADLEHSTDVVFRALAMLDEVDSRARDQLGMLEDSERTPKWKFYNAVLDCWIDAGGQLKMSRRGPESNRPGQPSGPLIEYFDAAVRPVMEDEAPGREAIYKVVVERKAIDVEFNARIEALEVRDGRKRGEW
jgi:hypothetical protein